MRGAVLVAFLVGLLLAGSVGAAATARVTITDAALTPKVTRISAPGSVTWTNKGAIPHVVISTTGAFKAFVLKVNGKKTIRFSRAGSYPYLVDGKRCGFVAAGGAKPGKNCVLAGGGGSPPPPPPPPSDIRKETIRYDIDIIASLHTVETFSGSNIPGNNGVLERELNWTGKWRRIELDVQIVGEARYVTTKQATAGRGSITGKLKYSETRANNGPCAGTIDYQRVKAKANLSGGRPDRGERYVSFDAYAVSSSAIDELTSSKQRAACRGNESGLPRWGDSETRLIVQGVYIDHPPGLSIHPMDTSWGRKTASGTPFPLDRLLAGRGFTLDTGVRTSRVIQQDYVERFTGRAKYIYKPVR
jgi:plastocyanin